MFYPIDTTLDTDTHLSKCPRCSLPIVIIPKGPEPSPLSLPLGEALEFLQHAADMVEAARTTIEEAVGHA